MRGSPVRQLAWLPMAVVVAAVIGGCGERDPHPIGVPPIVVVTMRDVGGGRLDYNHVVPGGRVVFKVVNAGRSVHRLALFPLPEDFPPIAEQLKGTERRPITPFAGVPDHLPGETASFAVDLEAGHRYALVDFSEDAEGVSQALKGMTSEFRTTGRAPAPS